MDHTKKCLEDQENYRLLKARFEEEHPKYCRRCYGTGFLPGGYDPDTGFCDPDPCPDCHEKGFCPVCGGTLDEFDICTECQWGAPGKAMPFLPDGPECLCFEGVFEEAINQSKNLRDWIEEELREKHNGDA